MEDLCTLARFHADDLSTHAVSLAIIARALNDAHESGNHLDRKAFHRAADLALALYRQEKKRFASVDAPAPLLDSLYLKAFVPGEDETEELPEIAADAVARRFHAEVMRLLYARKAEAEKPVAEKAAPASI
ncbi:MAG TPA: hypothetical protein VKT75_03690 [Acidobacteriaceae bacterium]|nr:hypothetical protein [Acidobacteriaceae bacterium]